MSTRYKMLAGVALSACYLPAVAGADTGADAVMQWNAHAGEAAKADCISPAPDPFHESRLYAMMHIAIHDALNAIDRRFHPYAYDDMAPSGASPEAAVAAAAHDVLMAEMPANPDMTGIVPGCEQTGLDEVPIRYAEALADVPDGQAKSDGIALGKAAADAIVALRNGDGSDTEFLVFGGVPDDLVPGVYRLPVAAAPGWGDVEPFVLQSADQFRPRAPYPVSCGKPAEIATAGSCKQYATDFEEVRLFGADDATGHSRTDDQSQVAIFWIESSPLSWNRIGRAVTDDLNLDMWENARLFGLLNMALADGYIASMSTKYHYNFWRPVTAIANADSDGNPGTHSVPGWTPFDPTPPIPEHESAHAVEGAVAAEVFRRVFGTDHATFTACSLSLRVEEERCGEDGQVLRTFHSFSDAAVENGLSRILNGYHFRNSVEQGLKHGRKIGAEAVRGHMRPAHEQGGS